MQITEKLLNRVIQRLELIEFLTSRKEFKLWDLQQINNYINELLKIFKGEKTE